MGAITLERQRLHAAELRLVWIDNRIDTLRALATSLTRHLGYQVELAIDAADGFRMLEREPADILFLDYSLGAENGISILPRILGRQLAKRVYVCTGYSYDFGVRKDIEDRVGRDERVGFIPKEWLPGAGDVDAIREFQHALESGAYLEVDATSAEHHADQIIADKATYPSWDAFAALDLPGRIALLKQAAEKTATARAEFHELGYRAVLYCGDWVKPRRVYGLDDELPDEDMLMHEGHESDAAPFLFSFASSIDDFSAPCNPPKRMRDYPFFGLAFAGIREEINFDTGNKVSLFAYEWFLEQGAIRPTFSPSMHTAGEVEFIGKPVHFSDVICRDSMGNSVRIEKLSGFAAINWTEERISAKCPTTCQGSHPYPNSSARLCRRRRGLLGRSFQKDLGIPIVLGPGSVALTSG